VCTTIKAIQISKVKVDVQKGALRFRENLIIDVFVSYDSHFYPLFSISCHNAQ
jgi:hypothetical protein